MAIDFEKLQDSPHLLDILIQMEDVLDTMDVYVFKNWLRGEVVEGPIVKRYWLDMTLRYPYDKMPDPKAGLRLLKHGVRVDYEKAKYESDQFGAGTVDEEHEEAKDGDENNTDLVWLVRISIPRRLVSQMNAAQHDFYDDEIDVDDVEDAQDTGLDDESGYHTDEQGQQPGPDDMNGEENNPGGVL
jgi:hypothetical protein